MKTLAIVTVFFLPLTLMASVYGTNFHEVWPHYSWDGGFATMIASFVVIGAGLFAWFRWRRWIYSARDGNTEKQSHRGLDWWGSIDAVRRPYLRCPASVFAGY